MTGYELSRAWFDWSFENPDLNTPNHTALYLWYVEKWNRCGQKDKISVTTSESMDAIGIKSRNTIAKIFADLVEWGFVKIITESKNQYSCNIISLAQNLSKHEYSTDKALDKALIQHSNKHEYSTDTINKQRNKETKKQYNYTSDFEEFWGLYEKPTGKIKSFQLWQKLPADDKVKIIPHVKFYKKTQPESKFRKDPERYLSNRLWDDFEPKVNQQTYQPPKRETVY